MNKTPLKSFKIIKEMYEHFVKKSRKQEPKLMICEKEDFDNVETALKSCEIDCKDYKLEEALVNLERHSKRYKGRKEDLDALFNVVKGYQYQKKNIVSLMEENKALKEKLGQKENDDEELGIDSHILIEALKQKKVYIKQAFFPEDEEFKEVDEFYNVTFEKVPNDKEVNEFISGEWVFSFYAWDNGISDWINLVVRLKDFGKTWSLKKEALQ